MFPHALVLCFPLIKSALQQCSVLTFFEECLLRSTTHIASMAKTPCAKETTTRMAATILELKSILEYDQQMEYRYCWEYVSMSNGI
ncbi:MAG: hypothetical protein J3R72DRAFT_441734 [Linnemannia gamsii]|nr:MAG: hypothetical protein J3R72DRAFT_441734 [Linnemannia gamsii]